MSAVRAQALQYCAAGHPLAGSQLLARRSYRYRCTRRPSQQQDSGRLVSAISWCWRQRCDVASRLCQDQFQQLLALLGLHPSPLSAGKLGIVVVVVNRKRQREVQNCAGPGQLCTVDVYFFAFVSLLLPHYESLERANRRAPLPRITHFLLDDSLQALGCKK